MPARKPNSIAHIDCDALFEELGEIAKRLDGDFHRAHQIIKQLRAAGWKQTDIGERIGKSQSWVSQVGKWGKGGKKGKPFTKIKPERISAANKTAEAAADPKPGLLARCKELAEAFRDLDAGEIDDDLYVEMVALRDVLAKRCSEYRNYSVSAKAPAALDNSDGLDIPASLRREPPAASREAAR